MSSENEHLVGRMFNELWSQGDLGMAEKLFAAGYVNHDPATPDYGKGPEAEKSIVRFYRKAFPDLLFTIDHMIEAGDFVTTRFTAQGTHRNELWGVPPTNKVVKVEGTVVIRASKGRIAERWVMWDALGLLQQLGAVPGWRPGGHGGAGETA